MSEHQYYEFAGVDRPLTPAEMAALRAASTRAAITPSGFVNHYHCGGWSTTPKSARGSRRPIQPLPSSVSKRS